MAETLLTSSSIKLFGRVLKDLKFNYDAADITQIGANNFLQEQLAQAPVYCYSAEYHCGGCPQYSNGGHN